LFSVSSINVQGCADEANTNYFGTSSLDAMLLVCLPRRRRRHHACCCIRGCEVRLILLIWLSSIGFIIRSDNSCYGLLSAQAFSVVTVAQVVGLRHSPHHGGIIKSRAAHSSSSSSSVGSQAILLLRNHPNQKNNEQNDDQDDDHPRSMLLTRTTTTTDDDDDDNHHHEKSTTSFLAFPPSTTMTAVVQLNFVAIIWGSQHALIKSVVAGENSHGDPSVFNLLRFGLSAAIASPYTPSLRRNGIFEDNFKTWRWGIELGLYMFLGFCFQSIGLEYTTAQRSGFLLYLNVKFVPFLGYVLFGRSIQWTTIASAITAFTGTALLGYSGGGSGANAWNVGDAWSIAAAVASALFILRLEDASKAVIGAAPPPPPPSEKVDNDGNNNDIANLANQQKDTTAAARLNAACLWTVAILSAIWTIITTESTTFSSPPYNSNTNIDDTIGAIGTAMVDMATEFPWQILYLGGIATALANFIQTQAQSKISAERASIIYAMDPVYGAVFAYWILGETLDGPLAWIGATLIVIAAAGNAFVFNDNDNRHPDE
jgi:drug/metabolite transporter (DMT)-like permease